MVEGGDESGQDQEASAANSESASENGESVSEGTGSEIETSEAEAAAPITPGRAPTPRARGSQCGVSIDPEGMTPGESLADASAAASTGKRKRWRDRFNLALANQQSRFYFASYFASVLNPSS